ncbi:MAG: HAD family phosphatase [Prevotella sp.]|nr:HAD family phosphatase [Prevotella sp.]
MIKTIIFDLGGVIITINHDEAVRRFEALGLKDAAQRLDPYTQGGIFGDLEEGKIDAEDFRRELSLLIGREVTYEECRYAWLGYCGDIPQRNLDMLQRLRDMGYRVVLLSNTNPYMMSFIRSTDFDGKGHSIDHYLDALYLSYQMKVMKPNETFFRLVLMAEQSSPFDCLFVDDGPRNVAAASQVGMHTFCPKNGEDWTEELLEKLKN